ncbi:hypothetical protein [Thalassotalea euphylliae]|uniref:Uncharacterized protein n=1 Tax=Thalassotalea euphylliae TaxID=1655234 RepID=A0A3E0U2Y7_9GAMM|nr:hypothetical protein [Thalassotalea euphylliae]REL31296.1 hypothetical protein DXX94_11560 [Thalassotalea euphylliae]
MPLDKEPPYLLTLIVAIVGWLLVNYVEKLQSTPLVEYSIEQLSVEDSFYWSNQIKCSLSSSSPKSLYKFSIRNLSAKTKFNAVTFHVKTQASVNVNEVVSARIIPHPPATAGKKASSCNTESATYPGLSIQPNATIDLLVGFSNELADPFIIVDNSSQAINLQRSNFQTWLITNEGRIIIALVLLLIIAFGRTLTTR